MVDTTVALGRRFASAAATLSCDSLADSVASAPARLSYGPSQRSYDSTRTAEDAEEMEEQMEKLRLMNSPRAEQQPCGGGSQRAAQSKRSYDSMGTAESSEDAAMRLAEICRMNPPHATSQQPGAEVTPATQQPGVGPPFAAPQKPGAGTFQPMPAPPAMSTQWNVSEHTAWLRGYSFSHPCVDIEGNMSACAGFVDFEGEMPTISPAKRLKRQTAYSGSETHPAGRQSEKTSYQSKENKGRGKGHRKHGEGLPPATEKDWVQRGQKRSESVLKFKSNPIYFEHQEDVHWSKRPSTPDPTNRNCSKRDWEADAAGWRCQWRKIAGVAKIKRMGFSEQKIKRAWHEAEGTKTQELGNSSEKLFNEQLERAIAILCAAS